MLNVVNIVIVFVLILVSVILHELAHGFVAYYLGDDTAKQSGRLTLNPLKHLDPVMSIFVPMLLYVVGAPVFGGAKPVPINKYKLRHGEWGMALVALAGPMTNLVIAFAMFMVGYLCGWLFSDDLIGEVVRNAVMINLGFMVFNLLPFPPLDGSRVLYAISPDFVREVMDKMETSGIIVVYMLVILFGGVLSSFMGMVINVILNGFYLLVGL